jgi:AcrR family transcriptional regulator
VSDKRAPGGVFRPNRAQDDASDMPRTEPRLGHWRKSPQQARTDQTLRALYEATAQLLERDGLERLSTNRIAARAGFAVGTIYQYFPNKTELLLAMAEAEVTHGLKALDRLCARMKDQPLEPTARAVLRLWLRSFGGRHKVMRVVLRAVSAERNLDEVHRRFACVAEAVATRLIEHASHAGTAPALAAETRFVLGHALLGTLRAALLEDSSLMTRLAFEDALVRLVMGLLQPAAESRRGE